jgi:hypothetical protein
MEIYIVNNDALQGPFNETQISDGLKRGEFSLEDEAMFAALYSELFRLGDIFIKDLLEGLKQLDGWLEYPSTIYEPTAESMVKGFNLILPIAHGGNIFAQFKIGKCYFEGSGVTECKKSGLEWLEKAGSMGSAEAQYYLGEFYLKQYEEYIERTESTLSLAFKWMKMAADQNYIWAVLNDRWKDCTPEHQNNCEKEFKRFLKKAEAGDASAQEKTSFNYEIGFGTKKCEIKAAYWKAEFEKNKSAYLEKFKILAEKGDERAELELSALTELSLLKNPEAVWKKTNDDLEKMKVENPEEYKKTLKAASKIPDFGPLPSYKPVPSK